MRPRLVVLALVVLTSVAHATSGQQPVAGTPGAVTGTVKVDGKPASGVTVMLVENTFQRDSRAAGTARVDKEGAFRIDGVPSGKYWLVVDAPALVADGDIDVAGKGVFVEDGATVKGVDIALHRGGVIAGHVTNKDGAPLVAMNVSVFRIDADGKPVEVQFYSRDQEMARTDDRGAYRIYGLLPGTYIVAAGFANDPSGMTFGSVGKHYTRAYFPGVATEGEARRLDVTAGDESGGVDFALAERTATYTVSGRIVDGETGAPFLNASAGFGPAVNGQLKGSFGYGAMTDAKGAFMLTGFAPGSYGIIGVLDGYYADPAIVEVTSEDITGVEVKMRRGGNLAGVAVIENVEAGKQTELLKQLAFLVRPAPVAGVAQPAAGPGSYGYSQVAADGTFRISGLKPGAYTIEPTGTTNETQSTLVRIERSGAPLDAAVEIVAGETIDDIRAVFAVGSGLVLGRVTFEGSLPARRYTSVRIRATDSTQTAKTTGVDDDGTFVVDKLPAGEYIVQATARFFDSAAPDLVQIRSEEQRVTVTASSRAEVNLVIRAREGGGDPK